MREQDGAPAPAGASEGTTPPGDWLPPAWAPVPWPPANWPPANRQPASWPPPAPEQAGPAYGANAAAAPNSQPAYPLAAPYPQPGPYSQPGPYLQPGPYPQAAYPPYPGYAAPSIPWSWNTPQPRSRRRSVAIALGALLVISVIFGLVLVTGSRSVGGGSVTATSPVDPTMGKVVFTDDFQSNLSGWYTGNGTFHTRFDYTTDGYVLTPADGNFVHFAFAPFRLEYEQVAATVAMQMPADAPEDVGAGVACRRGPGSGTLIYEFVVGSQGDWYIGRRGAISESQMPTVVAIGSGATPGFATVSKIEGMCATIDGRTTRLVLVVNGTVIEDTVDRDVSVPQGGWTVGIAVSGGESGQPAMTAKRFEERDLSEVTASGGDHTVVIGELTDIED